MNIPKKRIAILLGIPVLAVIIWLSGVYQHISFENIRNNRETVLSLVEQNYILSVMMFLALYISTAFFVPGTLALTVASGFFFGFAPGTFYSLLGACLGATMAFLVSRYLIGSWIQKKFETQLYTFNKEIERHGYNYLLFFRIVPVLPFFVVNYLAGITHITTWKFIWTTVAGMLPGALVCTYAGRQLGRISSVDRILSKEVIIALTLFGLLIILPPAVRHTKKFFIRNS